MENQIAAAIKAEDAKRLAGILQSANGNAPINQLSKGLDGMSPLQFASYTGNQEILSILLQQALDIFINNSHH